ncbi:reverse transcriptase [Canna indica]|uniref:Reverse transcriptase n=1 Tax=Canna indica TaxID=4628 RepID=A0AAQ3JVB7_9LILI|nr:reverse transcriptase [Canna indica]
MFECSFTRHFWSRIEHELGLCFKYKKYWNKGDRLKEDSKASSNAQKWSVEIIAASMWNLWKNKNNMCFQNISCGMNSMLCKTLADINWKSKVSSPVKQGANFEEILVMNKTLTNGILKIFCDASWKNKVKS